MRFVFRNTLLIIITALFSLFSQLSTAQDTPAEKERGFGFRGAGISAGWYNPSMDYWNNNYFKDHGWEGSFGGAPFFGAFLELSLYKNLYLRGAGSFWNQKVISGDRKSVV